MKIRNKSSKGRTRIRYFKYCKYRSERLRLYLSQIEAKDNDSVGCMVIGRRCPFDLSPEKCQRFKFKSTCSCKVIRYNPEEHTVIYDPATATIEMKKINRYLLKHGRLAKSVNRTK